MRIVHLIRFCACLIVRLVAGGGNHLLLSVVVCIVGVSHRLEFDYYLFEIRELPNVDVGSIV